jgi:hypothetical protein
MNKLQSIYKKTMPKAWFLKILVIIWLRVMWPNKSKKRNLASD